MAGRRWEDRLEDERRDTRKVWLLRAEIATVAIFIAAGIALVCWRVVTGR